MLRKRVLVVDDNPALLFLLREILEEDGYDVAHFDRGARALVGMRRYPPDLLFLDLHLEQHGMGMLLVDEVRHDPALSHIPIILFSADSRYLDHHEAELRAKNVAALHKPFDLDVVLALVTRLIGPATPPQA